MAACLGLGLCLVSKGGACLVCLVARVVVGGGMGLGRARGVCVFLLPCCSWDLASRLSLRYWLGWLLAY